MKHESVKAAGWRKLNIQKAQSAGEENIEMALMKKERKEMPLSAIGEENEEEKSKTWENTVTSASSKKS